MNTFELASLLKRKPNKGRQFFIQKVIHCLKEEASYLIKHYHSNSSEQAFKVMNNKKNFQFPVSETDFDEENSWRTTFQRLKVDNRSRGVKEGMAVMS